MLTFKDNKGQGLMEYMLVIILAAIIVIAILALIGPQLQNMFSQVINQI